MTTPNTPWMTDDERDKIIRSMPLYQTHDHVNNTANDKRIKAICNAIRNAAAAHYEPLLEAKDKLLAYSDGEFQRLHAQLAAKEKEVEELTKECNKIRAFGIQDCDEKWQYFAKAERLESENATLRAENKLLYDNRVSTIDVLKENANLKAEVERLKGENANLNTLYMKKLGWV